MEAEKIPINSSSSPHTSTPPPTHSSRRNKFKAYIVLRCYFLCLNCFPPFVGPEWLKLHGRSDSPCNTTCTTIATYHLFIHYTFNNLTDLRLLHRHLLHTPSFLPYFDHRRHYVSLFSLVSRWIIMMAPKIDMSGVVNILQENKALSYPHARLLPVTVTMIVSLDAPEKGASHGWSAVWISELLREDQKAF